MTAENLYFLVHSLTKEQKSKFTRFVKGNRKSLDLVLYDRILAAKSLNEKSHAKIRGKEFRNATQYYLYRCKLAERIIQSLVMYGQSRFDPAEFIRKAVQLDAVELADKAWQEEIGKAEAIEDYSQLVFLHDLARELNSIYKVVFNLPEGRLSRREVRERQDIHFEFDGILDQIRDAFRKDYDSKQMTAAALNDRVQHMEKPTFRAEVMAMKARVGVALLKEDYDQTVKLQGILVERMENAPYEYPVAQLVFEHTQIIRLAVRANQRDESVRYNLRLSQLEATSPIETRIVRTESILNQFTLGEYYANLNLIEEGLEGLDSHPDYFSEGRHAYLKMLAALGYFYQDEHKKSIRCLNKLRSIPAKSRHLLSWEPEALLATIHLDRGNIDVFDSLIRSMSATTEDETGQYPRQVIKVLRRISQVPVSERALVYENAFQSFQKLLLSPAEQRLASRFNIALWLESKVKGVSQASLISETGKASVMPQAIAQ